VSTIAFIFARGGSKGLPGKNIRLFAGKPLIAWSIEQAQAVKRIEKIVVSTDSDAIASVAREYGADVPFMRPSELAGDESPEWLSWRHALSYLRGASGNMPETMVVVPATAPLRMPIDIENSLDEYERGGAEVVITVSSAHRNPYFNMVKRNLDGTVGLVIPPTSAISRRQDAAQVYDMTTVCYVANPEYVMANDSMFEGRVRAVQVPVERAIDIDSLLDFRMAEILLSFRGQDR
jgi:N-acylneuraminate cytidylyltransferase